MKNSNKRIVLMRPPMSLSAIYGDLAGAAMDTPPLNLLLLAAIARGHGFEPHILDCRLPDSVVQRPWWRTYTRIYYMVLPMVYPND